MSEFYGTCKGCAHYYYLRPQTGLCSLCHAEVRDKANALLSDGEKWRRFAVAWYAWKLASKSTTPMTVRDIGASWR